MNGTHRWQVLFHDAFIPEFEAFSTEAQDALLAAADSLSKLGPSADRPQVGTLHNPKHPNMKELRFKVSQGREIWRAAFAFDPVQDAIILVAAAKQRVNEERFYRSLIRTANERFDQHLRSLKLRIEGRRQT